MICDGREVLAGTVLTAEICIVGAGAAGITLALELAKKGREVVLLEGGGFACTPESQDVYKGTVVNPDLHSPLEGNRYRVLGGTTSVWGGQCLPFDPIDFEFRDYVPYSGWPISRAELDPFYQIAHYYCECGAYTYQVADALPCAPPSMIPKFIEGEVVTTGIDRYSFPTNFGTRYLADLQASSKIRLYLHVNCLNIQVNPEGNRVSSLDVASSPQTTFIVKAKDVILAAGGLEVTRLLLVSNDVHRQGLGNHSDWLGRGYMGHICGDISTIHLHGKAQDVMFGYEVDDDGIYCRRRLWISEEVQRRHNMLNFVAWIDTMPLYDPAHGQGVLSLAFLAKNIRSIQRRIPPEYSKVLSMGKPTSAMYGAHLKNIFMTFPSLLSFYPRFVYERFVKKRMIPSLIRRGRSNAYGLHYHGEQAPNPASRVTLSDDRDAFGMPRLQVDFQFLDCDIESIFRGHQIIDEQLRKSGSGYLSYSHPQDHKDHIRSLVGTGSHQLGATRMAADPSQGVVDAHCRVHGVDNLFIASSSVFPTSSQANPTLTIVAMAARLADYLQTQ